jgi:hypothetical protein
MIININKYRKKQITLTTISNWMKENRIENLGKREVKV